jgi:hypothetical protein
MCPSLMNLYPSKGSLETFELHSHLDILTRQTCVAPLINMRTVGMVHTTMCRTSTIQACSPTGRHTHPLPLTKHTQLQATSTTTIRASCLSQPQTFTVTPSSQQLTPHPRLLPLPISHPYKSDAPTATATPDTTSQHSIPYNTSLQMLLSLSIHACTLVLAIATR